MSNHFPERIIVTEYPKSGGTWLVSLLGDCLGLPKRDIYVGDGYKTFDIRNHPWYQDSDSPNLTSACVIKSHELPASPLVTFPAQYIHLVRDGRDVVVSKYFYERDFCVKNGIYASFDVSWSDYVRKTALEWNNYVLAWLDTDCQWFRYEDLLHDTFGTLTRILLAFHLSIDSEKVNEVIKMKTAEKMRKSLDKTFSSNTFIRKAVAGDWKNHFTEKDTDAFENAAGDSLRLLGY